MTAQELIENIECKKIIMLQKRIAPKAVTMNGTTKEKIVLNSVFKDGLVLGLEILIDDKLADDEFRLLRK